ncbi:ceramide synthase 2-like [Oratosquilla oratoria]|uniref:ceramide synthase 2-like n=1 Tax=Oratosquilla oratoria TaxID=337810 RepID=UPI003F77298F
MTELLSRFSEWFWNHHVWLPPGYTWEDLVPNDEVSYANPKDLRTYPFLLMVAFFVIRYLVFYPLVARPLARAMGLREQKPRHPEPLPELESLYSGSGTHPPEERVTSVAKDLGWTERQVERWLRRKWASNRVTKFEKYLENFWMLAYYTVYCVLGVVVLHDEKWLKDIRECWYGFPKHSIEDDVWWYYMIPLGYYSSTVIVQAFNYHAKDALQMLSHHILTIFLISFSWICNLVRIGTLVLLVHECADIPLLFAKMCLASGHTRIADISFVLFLLLWIVTRLGVFPLWIMPTCLLEGHVIVAMFPVYYIFNSMLGALFLMHLMWTYFILRTLVRKLTSSKLQDSRSSSSSGQWSDVESDKVDSKKEN